MRFSIAVGLLLMTPLALSADIDQRLQGYVQKFGLAPLPKVTTNNPALLRLGHSLFTTRLLSGNKNISCHDCHHPRAMTHDGLPLALGEGATGVQIGGQRRQQASGRIIPRNTPALFNLDGINVMFWDGRISFDPATRTFTTPLAELNGLSPLRREITSALSGALAAQAIFPIADHLEMRGAPGSNPVADAPDEFAAWELIVERLQAEPAFARAFNEVFPGEKINIGHIGTALAEFQRVNFAFSDTAYDRYLKGERSALTEEQKLGMDVFFNKGRCGNCHNGPQLSNFEFHSLAVPQIGPGKHAGDDLGRAAIDPAAPKYSFRVPPLRNVALTAPYMHDGAFATLLEVVEHYDDVAESLRSYDFAQEWQNYVEAILTHDHNRDEERLVLISPDLERELHFTEDEEEALIEFLETALTDRRLLQR